MHRPALAGAACAATTPATTPAGGAIGALHLDSSQDRIAPAGAAVAASAATPAAAKVIGAS